MSAPSASRVSVVATIVRRALREARDDDVAMTAQALAYSLFLAIPATALVVLGVFSVVADAEAIDSLVDRAGAVMPAEATTLLRDSLERSADSRGGSVLLIVVGFALAAWSTTSAATTLMKGLTRAYDRDDERGFVSKRLTAALIVGALVLGAALVVFFLVLGPHLEQWVGSTLEAETLTAWTWWTVQWPILLAALLFAFAVVLYVGPDVEHRTWRVVAPGALTAVVLWLVASGMFTVYAANFGSYNKSWGTLSAVVVTLVWLWLTSAALLLGAEVNSEVARVVEEKEEPDRRAAGAPAVE
jgi:membrane protein